METFISITGNQLIAEPVTFPSGKSKDGIRSKSKSDIRFAKVLEVYGQELINRKTVFPGDRVMYIEKPNRCKEFMIDGSSVILLDLDDIVGMVHITSSDKDASDVKEQIASTPDKDVQKLYGACRQWYNAMATMGSVLDESCLEKDGALYNLNRTIGEVFGPRDTDYIKKLVGLERKRIPGEFTEAEMIARRMFASQNQPQRIDVSKVRTHRGVTAVRSCLESTATLFFLIVGLSDAAGLECLVYLREARMDEVDAFKKAKLDCGMPEPEKDDPFYYPVIYTTNSGQEVMVGVPSVYDMIHVAKFFCDVESNVNKGDSAPNTPSIQAASEQGPHSSMGAHDLIQAASEQGPHSSMGTYDLIQTQCGSTCGKTDNPEPKLDGPASRTNELTPKTKDELDTQTGEAIKPVYYGSWNFTVDSMEDGKLIKFSDAVFTRNEHGEFISIYFDGGTADPGDFDDHTVTELDVSDEERSAFYKVRSAFTHKYVTSYPIVTRISIRSGRSSGRAIVTASLKNGWPSDAIIQLAKKIA